jgi:hypothetical protein
LLINALVSKLRRARIKQQLTNISVIDQSSSAITTAPIARRTPENSGRTPSPSLPVGETEVVAHAGVPNPAGPEEHPDAGTSNALDRQVTAIVVDPVAEDVMTSKTSIPTLVNQAGLNQDLGISLTMTDIAAFEAIGTNQAHDADYNMAIDSIASDVGVPENSTDESMARVDQSMDIDLIASDIGASETLMIESASSDNAAKIPSDDESTHGQPVLTLASAIVNAPVQKPAPIKYINGMSAYEWERAENIKRNKKILTSLGLDNTGEQVFGKRGKENRAPSKSNGKNPTKRKETVVVNKRTLRSTGKGILERSAHVITDIELWLIHL